MPNPTLKAFVRPDSRGNWESRLGWALSPGLVAQYFLFGYLAYGRSFACRAPPGVSRPLAVFTPK